MLDVSCRIKGASFNKAVQLIFHMQLGQFSKAADPLAVDSDLRHRARAVGDLCKFAACSHVGVDARFIVGNIPLAEQ